jgi:hypothetical protein
VAAPWLSLWVSPRCPGLPLQVNAAQRDVARRFFDSGAYEVLHHFHADSTTQLFASLDFVRGIESGVEGSAGLGMELVMDDCLFLRAGYSTVSGKGSGGAVGVGMIWDRFEVAVGKSFSSNLDGSEAFQVTFAVGLSAAHRPLPALAAAPHRNFGSRVSAGPFHRAPAAA